jgi:CPA2 family monovalent cation:H+ antiporter-2
VHGPWLKDLFVFLVAAGLVVPLFHRARIGAVLAFLLVGVAVAPTGLGLLAGDYPWIRYFTIEDRARAEPFAELGVMFLLFLLGIEVSLARLWSLRRFVFGIGGLQFLLSALAIGGAVRLAGLGTDTAIVLGLCLAMSSTAIVMQLLEEQGRTATALGHIALSVLLFQDLMVAPVLVGTEMLGYDGKNIALGLALALVQAAVAVAAIVFAGRYLVRPLFRLAALTGSRELIMAITLLLLIGLASATGLAGLSSALGAFLAGLLLSETEYRHQIEIDIAPFKGLLIGLFFITVGMSVDVAAAWAQIVSILGAVAALFVVKIAILWIACRLLGVGLAQASELAILLGQAGEFAFVVIGLGRSNGVIDAEPAQFATAVVALSMVLTPFFARTGLHIGRRLQRAEHDHHKPAADAAGLTDHVIVGGYGRVGRLVARALDAENVPFIALDHNIEIVAEQRAQGQPVYYGDAGRPELLDRVGAARARAFVVTVNSPRAAERMVTAALRRRPDVPVFARASDPVHAAILTKLGAVGVIPEAVESSLQLAGRLLEGLGLPEEAVLRRLAEMREAEMGRLTGEEARPA